MLLKFLSLLTFLSTCYSWGNHETVVAVSYLGQRTQVSQELLEKIHQDKSILEITLITKCISYGICEDQVELWSNKLRNLKGTLEVNKWKLNQSGFRGPFGSTGNWEYRQKLTR